MKTRLSISERRRARARMDQSVDSQSKHTQGEGLEVLHKEGRVFVADKNGNCICDTGKIGNKWAEANAQRIVKAVNMHDELVDWLKKTKSNTNRPSKRRGR